MLMEKCVKGGREMSEEDGGKNILMRLKEAFMFASQLLT